MQLHHQPYNHPPLMLFKGLKEQGGNDTKLADMSDDDVEHGRRKLVCKFCRSVITRPDLGMEIDGKHHHVFFNPHGYVFELGCFASAKNIVPTGPKTDEFTWFPGYAWQVVACAGCQAQLGWRYTGNHGGFYGLILKALVEEQGRKD